MILILISLVGITKLGASKSKSKRICFSFFFSKYILQLIEKINEEQQNKKKMIKITMKTNAHNYYYYKRTEENNNNKTRQCKNK